MPLGSEMRKKFFLMYNKSTPNIQAPRLRGAILRKLKFKIFSQMLWTSLKAFILNLRVILTYICFRHDSLCDSSWQMFATRNLLRRTFLTLTSILRLRMFKINRVQEQWSSKSMKFKTKRGEKAAYFWMRNTLRKFQTYVQLFRIFDIRIDFST